MYRLVYSSNSSISGSESDVGEAIFDINSVGDGSNLIVREGANIISFKRKTLDSKLIKVWNETVYDNCNEYSLSQYPWVVTHKLRKNKTIIAVLHPNGVRFFQENYSKPGLDLLVEDGNFHELYNFEYLFGNFYPDQSWRGFMTRDSNKAIRFYAVTAESFDPENNDPLLPLETELSFSPSWSNTDTEFFTVKLKRNATDIIGLATKNGLEFYTFNEQHLLEKLLSTNIVNKSFTDGSLKDSLFFANLTNQIYQDILHFNASGLFTYQYNSNVTDYVFINLNADFSQDYGWKKRYGNSIKVFDINLDGRDDLVYTGSQGLTGLSFDLSTKSWDKLLSSDQGVHLYSNIVAVLPLALPESTQVITQGTDGILNLAKLVKVTSERGNSTRNNASKPLVLHARGDTNRPVFENSIGTFSSEPTPVQISRKNPSPKITLLWEEQWDTSFLKETVDPASGQIRLSIPLVDVLSSTGSRMQLEISYNSKVRRSDLLGLGWSISLPQEYIYVDYHGSVFPEDTQYFLMMNGRPQRLHLIKEENSVRKYELAKGDDKSKVSIEFHILDEHWVVQGETEKGYYGTAKHYLAKDAIQRSLTWPYWRGAGNAKSEQEEIVTKWYLNTRTNENTDQILYYYYDKKRLLIPEGKQYDSELRLNSIIDNGGNQLTLNYNNKSKNEYKESSPVDDKGNVMFPLPVDLSYFLDGYNVTSARFSQVVQFSYDLIGDKRFLKGINQRVAAKVVPILEFTYESANDHHVLKSCSSLAHGLTAEYAFELVTPPSPLIIKNNVLKYPVREMAKISYGPDYGVISHRNFNPGRESVSVRILNRDMTLAIINIVVSLISETKNLKDYTVHAYAESMIIYAKSLEYCELLVLRRTNNVWNKTPVVYTFDKDAVVRFDEKFTIVAEPGSNKLALIHRCGQESEWKKEMVDIPRDIKLLSLQKNLLVTYDDKELCIFHYDNTLGWQRKVLESDVGGLVSLSDDTINTFDINTEIKDQLLSSLNQSALQVLNNFILLSALEEVNGQLVTKVFLFLVNANYKVAKHEVFEIHREDLYKLTKDSKSKDGNLIYHFGYIKEDGLFKVRVANVSGNQISKISNRNKKQDEIDKQKKGANESEDFQKSAKGYFFPDWSLYSVQVSQNGVYCGNDTLLRLTGTGWEKEPLPAKTESILLGTSFVMEPTVEDQTQFKLYKQSADKKKDGNSLIDIDLYSTGRMINRYPAYIAFQPMENQIKLITFKDEKTIGMTHTFRDEALLGESDWQNLITIRNVSTSQVSHAESKEILVRPTSTLNIARPQLFVKHVSLTDGHSERLTGYEHSYDISKDELSFSEIATTIPGANKSLHGWHQASRSFHVYTGNVTTTEEWFDASGKQIVGPSKDDENDRKNTSLPANPSLLFDRSGKWLISDFSPYSLADNMVGYFGFESYELNGMETENKSNISSKNWTISNASIVRNEYAFSGESFLRLNSTKENKSWFEGTFEPLNQVIRYLATCWVRCNVPLEINTHVSYLKAILHTKDGQEVIGLRSQVKAHINDWTYLELPLDFAILKQIYRDYMKHERTNSTREASRQIERTRFKIVLKVEAPEGQSVELDHIRFTPFEHDFEATIYDPASGKSSAHIQRNGLITRTIYNHLQQEIASIDEDSKIGKLNSYGNKGRHVENSLDNSNSTSHPSVLTLEPEDGFYERFDKFSLVKRWHMKNISAWNVGPGQLWHIGDQTDEMSSREKVGSSESSGIRFYFALQESTSSILVKMGGLSVFQMQRLSSEKTDSDLANKLPVKLLPPQGEVVVLLEGGSLFMWFDGTIFVDHLEVLMEDDKAKSATLTIEAQGKVLLEDLFYMENPQVTVKYFNSFGEKTQVIQLENSDTALVTETLYDEVGREAITTKKSRVQSNKNETLLSYRKKFVTNRYGTNSESVWISGVMQGEVGELNKRDKNVPFTRTVFAANPLNQEKTLGLPGPEFSISGQHTTHLSDYSNLAIVDNLFPSRQGYRQKVEYTPNGSVRVAVFNKGDNQVAEYVRVPGFNHLLSTNEYDKENRLTKILPPLYHEKVDTASKTTPWIFGDVHLSKTERKLQQKLGTFYSYDERGNLLQKKNPDTSTTEYLYDSQGHMRFMAEMRTSNVTDTVVYFNYDTSNQLINTGHISRPMSLVSLRGYLDETRVAFSNQYQQFDYSDYQVDTFKRGRVKNCVTFNEGEPIAEKLSYNAEDKIVSKGAILVSDSGIRNELAREYIRGKTKTLTYPIDFNGGKLKVVHSYNRLGQLVGLGTVLNPTYFAQFSYHPTGEIATERIQPNTSNDFTRSYKYNSPGFLEEISDPFVTEKIYYTSSGYGQSGYGDGLVMKSSFNATWSEFADGRWFQVEESDLKGDFAKVCIKALRKHSYLSQRGNPIKQFSRRSENSLPLVCGGETMRDIAKLLATKQKPVYYGHRYAYGNHQELVKAKYFSSVLESSYNPLQPNVFAEEIPQLNSKQSVNVWELLSNASYITTDQQRTDPKTAVGKSGLSLVRDKDLMADLENLDTKYVIYIEPIKNLIMSAVGSETLVTLPGFITKFLQWQGVDCGTSSLIRGSEEETAKKIGSLLIANGYLPNSTDTLLNPLEPKFINVLKPYRGFMPKIVKVLTKHFAYQLGESPFDVESYKIDANGNHRLFYTGFNRYQLTYNNGSNQINSIKLDWRAVDGSEKIFRMKHDRQGNVIQALHKNIENIEYHPVSRRPTRVTLTDGRKLRFFYDAQGERLIKRVYGSDGKLTKERFYLRDEKGNVLMDKQVSYFKGSVQKIVTVYIHGPRGLLGFLRDNKFYSVTTDHSGSVRLVVNNGRVVAAYDYLPYGQLMRSFGDDPGGQIIYRYTGQEWDEETGLYNYHARLYDPDIGRFYQPDPKAQYFSPYKYAGNSPVSVIDPDGELAFLITCLVLGVVGAYLGAAAANNRWNPLDWDFADSGTWLGIGGGALAGGLLPVGFGASVAAIGGGAAAAFGVSAATATWIGASGTVALGIGGAYLMTASSSGNWNPLEWSWDKPEVWSSVFQGFGAGSGIAGGIGVAHNFANTGKALNWISKVFNISRNSVKVAFLTVSYTAGGGVAFAAGVMSNNGNYAFWEWDWTSPSTWAALIDGFDTGLGWPQNFAEITRGLGKIAKNPKRLGSMLGKEATKRAAFKAILKNPKHPLYKMTTSIVMVYFMGASANGDFDITKWSLSSYSTYEGVLNGVFFGKDTSNMLQYARKSKNKQSPKVSKSSIGFSLKVKDLARKFKGFLDTVQLFKRKVEYQRVITQAFESESTFRSKLDKVKDVSKVQIQEAENFLQNGIEKWKRGESKMPEVLERLIDSDVNQKMHNSDQDLAEWRRESSESLRKQNEVFPDQDSEFPVCRLRGKRAVIENPASVPFKVIKIEEGSRDFSVTFEVNGERHMLDSRKLYDFIPEQFADININPTMESFVAKHNEITRVNPETGKSDYVLVGYHGTSEISALSILNNGFTPSRLPNEMWWDGVYVGEDLKLALVNYANNANQFDINNPKDHARVLAVYASKNDIKNIGVTTGLIRDRFDVGKTGFSENRQEGSIISGREGERLEQSVHNEVVLKENLNLKVATLPITSENDFKAIQKYLELREFAHNIVRSGQGHLPATEKQNTDLKKLLSVNNLNEADFESVVRNFYTNDNDAIRLMEDALAMRDAVKLRNDFSFENARRQLNLEHLSEAGYTGLREIMANRGILESAGDVQAIREVFNGGSSGVGAPGAQIREALVSGDWNENDFRHATTEVLNLRDNGLENSQLSLEHSLQYNLGEAQDVSSMTKPDITYHCGGGRRKRSIGLVRNSIVRNNDSIIDVSQFEVIRRNVRDSLFQKTASSSASCLRFWPVKLIKTASAALANVFGYHRESEQGSGGSSWYGNGEYSQQKATILDYGDKWLQHANIDGLLTWGILISRKITGYKPQLSKLASQQSNINANIEIDIYSAEIVDVFLEYITKCSKMLGIEREIGMITQNVQFYKSNIQIAHNKLACGEQELIIKLLSEHFVKVNGETLRGQVGPERFDAFVLHLSESSSKLIDRLLESEQILLEHSRKVTSFPNASENDSVNSNWSKLVCSPSTPYISKVDESTTPPLFP